MTTATARIVRTAADVMITNPRIHPSDATVAQVRAAFDNDHHRMVLLVRSGILLGTLVRGDIPGTVRPGDRALAWAVTKHRTVGPAVDANIVGRRLNLESERRIAVVDAERRLLGLVCLKRDRTGFCTTGGVRARARDHASRSPREPDHRAMRG